MKKNIILLTLIMGLSLSSCSFFDVSQKTSNQSEVSEAEKNNTVDYQYDLQEIKNQYGQFSVDSEGSYSNKNGVLTLSTNQCEYILSGYYEGHIDIVGTKVTVILNNCLIYSPNSYSVYYEPESKSVEIKSMKDTTNYLINNKYEALSSVGLIQSNNNIKITGRGTLNLYAETGHAVKGSNISIKNTNINVFARGNSDLFKAKLVAVLTDTDIEGHITSEVCINTLQGDTVFDTNMNASGNKGMLYIFGGTFKINNVNTFIKAESDVFIAREAIYDGTTYIPQVVNLTMNDVYEDVHVVSGDLQTTSSLINATLNGSNYSF